MSYSLKTSAFIYLTSLFMIPLPFITFGQSHNYWTRSFNEESSLLSGAVVGGGAGPSAIYYNPASISEVVASKFSLNASLFSFTFYNGKNALGDGIDLESAKGIIEPRFVSYMINSKRFPKWSFEIAILNNEIIKTGLIESVDEQMDVLTHVPGNERYFALYRYGNQYRDDWVGTGGSVKLSDHLFIGLGMFVTIKSLEFENSVKIEAISSSDSILIENEYVSSYTASYENSQYLKFNDYRLLWKGGILYKSGRLSFGLCITTPSIGVYSDGKRVTRKEKQSNISDPETGEAIPDFIIADYKEKEDMEVSYKTPFAIAAGLNYYFPDSKRTLFTSVEYFSTIEPYRMAEATESPDISSGFVNEAFINSEWLTYANGARAVLNAAIGYSRTLQKNIRMMVGFRTDFNYRKNLDLSMYDQRSKIQGLNLDLYHITGGLSWSIFGQDIITGLEYTVGSNKNQKQITNLSDPVEFNYVENLALQGTRNNNMNSLLNSISFYFGASFNFGGEKK